jgi:putative glutamine amidotransferase
VTERSAGERAHGERRPLIGVTGFVQPYDNIATGMLPTIGARSADVYAVQAAGGIAVVLPPTDNPEAIARFLDTLDGFLFTGGRDVDPAHYGESALNDTVVVSPERDAFELPLIRAAVDRDMPVLAICRGCQVLGVALGGSLWQDVPTQMSDPQVHWQMAPRDHVTHSVTVKPETLLHRILNVGDALDLEVNTFHHQAIKSVPAALIPTAYAPDGCVEGVEAPSKRFVVGVQWHPEFLAPGFAVHRRLFDALVSAASK